jgi:flagellin
MAIGDISLTAGMRSNLLTLQATSTLLDRTQTRLSTGKKVSSPLDDPVSFFKAQSYTNRASDLAALKDGMSDAIQTVKAADAGIKGITALLNSAKSIATAARSASGTTDFTNLEGQFNEIMTQIADLAADSGYGGVDLLGSPLGTLTVAFDPAGDHTLTITGQATTTSSVGGSTFVAADFENLIPGGTPNITGIQAAITSVDDALGGLRTLSAGLSSSLSTITARQEFTSNMIGTLQTGADNLTLADMNEEGANMLMLQTRQSLGVTALSLASQAAQSVLRLFG